jgi:hypothetical protein
MPEALKHIPAPSHEPNWLMAWDAKTHAFFLLSFTLGRPCFPDAFLGLESA